MIRAYIRRVLKEELESLEEEVRRVDQLRKNLREDIQAALLTPECRRLIEKKTMEILIQLYAQEDSDEAVYDLWSDAFGIQKVSLSSLRTRVTKTLLKYSGISAEKAVEEYCEKEKFLVTIVARLKALQLGGD